MVFHKGESLQVWSNSANAWLDGTCEEYAATEGIYDGYHCPAGAVKVQSKAGVKWVMPDQVASVLRKVSRPEVAVAAAAFMEKAEKCKNGCGRPCQPGLTRSMKKYDTCCKSCAQNPGAGEHDENCGGVASLSAPRPRKKTVKRPEAKIFISQLLKNSAGLQATANQAYNEIVEATGGGFGVKEVVPALIKILRPILHDKDESIPTYPQKIFDDLSDGRGNLTSIAFVQLVKQVFMSWFPRVAPVSTEMFVKQNMHRLEDVYNLKEVLGEGTFGIVYRAEHKISGETRVCKKIKSGGKEPIEKILSEIGTMAKLDHPNVIKVYEFFYDTSGISQIMEPCNGGELQDRIEAVYRKGKAPYGEDFIADVIKQVLRAVAFMHAARFAHKDLKPQNIMMVDDTSSSIKVIDFGISELFEPGKSVSSTFGGTLLYMAPEIFNQVITMKVDVWAIGVIMFNLITGDFPFAAQWPADPAWWQQETIRKISQDPLPVHPRYSHFSRELRALMTDMLNKDLRARPGAAKCLEHDWFTKKFSETLPPLSVGITQCLDAFSSQPELKQAVFLLMAHQSAVPAVLELRKIFTHFDVRNKGSLPIEDLQELLERAGYSDLGAERAIHALDPSGDGHVNWTEFMAAALCVILPRNRRVVDAAFAFFDRDNDGSICIEDLEHVLATAHSGWKEKLREEFKDISGNPTSTAVSKEQFGKWLTHQMIFASGDKVSAVMSR